MPDVTALELVNTVLNFHRFPEVSSFSKTEAKVALKVVNMAIDKVLNSNDWDFARRHDGAFGTEAAYTSTANFAQLSGPSDWIQLSTAVALTSTETRGVLRFVNQETTLSGEQQVGIAYPIDRWYDVSAGTVTVAEFAGEWFGDPTPTTNNYTFYTAEYVLPSYVRGMISASKQDSGRITVEMISPELRLEELSTEPHGNLSDQTRIVYQGGSARPTINSATADSDYGLRVILWPVPETRFKIDYSYWFLYPQLVNPTDELQGISQSAAHDVVNWAYAHSNLTAIGNDPKLGTALKNDTRYEVSETRRAEKAVMSYDTRMTPWGSIPRGHPYERNPRARWDTQRIVSP